MSNLTDAVGRPVRTATQGGTAWLLVEFIDAFLWNMDERQYGIAVALLTVVISYAQNLIENRAGVAFLRELPDREVDVMEKNEKGAFTYDGGGVVLLLLAVVGVVVIVLALLDKL